MADRFCAGLKSAACVGGLAPQTPQDFKKSKKLEVRDLLTSLLFHRQAVQAGMRMTVVEEAAIQLPTFTSVTEWRTLCFHILG